MHIMYNTQHHQSFFWRDFREIIPFLTKKKAHKKQCFSKAPCHKSHAFLCALFNKNFKTKTTAFLKSDIYNEFEAIILFSGLYYTYNDIALQEFLN